MQAQSQTITLEINTLEINGKQLKKNFLSQTSFIAPLKAATELLAGELTLVAKFSFELLRDILKKQDTDNFKRLSDAYFDGYSDRHRAGFTLVSHTNADERCGVLLYNSKTKQYFISHHNISQCLKLICGDYELLLTEQSELSEWTSLSESEDDIIEKLNIELRRKNDIRGSIYSFEDSEFFRTFFLNFMLGRLAELRNNDELNEDVLVDIFLLLKSTCNRSGSDYFDDFYAQKDMSPDEIIKEVRAHALKGLDNYPKRDIFVTYDHGQGLDVLKTDIAALNNILKPYLNEAQRRFSVYAKERKEQVDSVIKRIESVQLTINSADFITFL